MTTPGSQTISRFKVFCLSMLGILCWIPTGALAAEIRYFPVGAMTRVYSGLGNNVRIKEIQKPLGMKDGRMVIEISREISYVNFPKRKIVATYGVNPKTGRVVQLTSTSAFGDHVWTFHPPLLIYRLPFEKGESWDVQDGQNRSHSKVWGKVRVDLPFGTMTCWVVEKVITYDLIRRKSPQILYDYYEPSLGWVAEGAWASDGKWHWSRKLLSVKRPS